MLIWVSREHHYGPGSQVVKQFLDGSCQSSADTNEFIIFSQGLYLAWVNPYGIHVESMESIMAESSANLLFHGHHGFHMEGSWNG